MNDNIKGIVLEIEHIIRRLDPNRDWLEYWTQDGECNMMLPEPKKEDENAKN